MIVAALMLTVDEVAVVHKVMSGGGRSGSGTLILFAKCVARSWAFSQLLVATVPSGLVNGGIRSSWHSPCCCLMHFHHTLSPTT